MNNKQHQGIEIPKTTHMLMRRLPRKYANQFINHGTIKFGYPDKWIRMCKNGDNRIGDDCEGVFSSSSTNCKGIIAPHRKNVERLYKDDKVYLRSKDVLMLPTLCLYGINDTSFHTTAKNCLGIEQDVGKVPFEYFSDVASDMSKEEYNMIEKDEQPVILMISNPSAFMERLINALYKLGFKSEDIIAGPVCYLKKTDDFICTLPFPGELFLKDMRYANQSEIRIVLNCHSDVLRKVMDECNYSVSIGSISDIAFVEDLYFSDMKFAKQDNKLLYELPEEKVSDIEMSFDKLVLYAIAASHHVFVPKDSNMFKNIRLIKEMLFNSYGVRCYLRAIDNHPKDGVMHFSLVFEGASEEQNKTIEYITNNALELLSKEFGVIASDE